MKEAVKQDTDNNSLETTIETLGKSIVRLSSTLETDLLRQVAEIPLSGRSSLARERLRREAVALVSKGELLEAAYSYRIVALDQPAARGDQTVHLGGTTLWPCRN